MSAPVPPTSLKSSRSRHTATSTPASARAPSTPLQVLHVPADEELRPALPRKGDDVVPRLVHIGDPLAVAA